MRTLETVKNNFPVTNTEYRFVTYIQRQYRFGLAFLYFYSIQFPSVRFELRILKHFLYTSCIHFVEVYLSNTVKL